MTNDLVERLREERDALHAGLSAIIHCQSALRRSEMREAAAGLLDKAGLKPMWFDGDQSPFVRRALTAEARVRELEAEVQTLKMALEDATCGITAAANESEIRADERAEAYERCAKVAEEMPNMVAIGPKHVRGLRGSDVAAAIRRAALEDEN